MLAIQMTFGEGEYINKQIIALFRRMEIGCTTSFIEMLYSDIPRCSQGLIPDGWLFTNIGCKYIYLESIVSQNRVKIKASDYPHPFLKRIKEHYPNTQITQVR